VWQSSSKDSSEDMASGDDHPGGSGRSSRRSSIVSMLQRRMSRGQDSVDSCASSGSEGQGKVEYRVVVLGGSMVGKTSIISQFLYDTFIGIYKETVDEMYHGEFDVGGCDLSLNIQDTGGSYVDEFPAMIGVSLQSADAVILVYAVDDRDSFEEVARFRRLVHSYKGDQIPMVVVGNKIDVERDTSKEAIEATVLFDWENGYVECSAKNNVNVSTVFKELLNQARARYDISNSSASKGSLPSTPLVMKRRTSLPQVPAFSRLLQEEGGKKSTLTKSQQLAAASRSSSFAARRRDSCKVQ